jgi:predicted SprT family Zn-dependent metalloprotease
MELQAAEQLAWNLMQEFRLSQNGWMFWWDNAKRRFGSCCTATRRITLSRELTERNDQPQVEDTIRHEIAHALAGSKHGHDDEWKRQCAVTGANPQRCYDSEQVDSPKGDWQATCGVCGRLFTKFRRPLRELYCADRKCRQMAVPYISGASRRCHPARKLVWRHKNAVDVYPPQVLSIADQKGLNLGVSRQAAINAMKAQLRREQEMEEMKAKIAELESKLGRK